MSTHNSSFRILIMGAAGAGSTTLGKTLAKTHQWSHFESDEYYWMPTNPPFTNKRPPALRVQQLYTDLNKQENWIISGVLCGWGNFIIPHLTHVIFLYADWPTRLRRIKQREQLLFGDRILKDGDMFKHHLAFMQWASLYDSSSPVSRTKKKHLDWLAALPHRVQVTTLNAGVEPDVLLSLANKHIKDPRRTKS